MVLTVDEVRKSLQNFGWSDYGILVFMLFSCMLVGVHFGHQKVKKSVKRTSKDDSEVLDYIFGGRKLAIFPVSMSLVASSLSGIGVLGTSTEAYLYGSHYIATLLAIVFEGVALHYIVIPVFYDLKLVSIYEYLERRFGRELRILGSFIYIMSTVSVKFNGKSYSVN